MTEELKRKDFVVTAPFSKGAASAGDVMHRVVAVYRMEYAGGAGTEQPSGA